MEAKIKHSKFGKRTNTDQRILRHTAIEDAYTLQLIVPDINDRSLLYSILHQ